MRRTLFIGVLILLVLWGVHGWAAGSTSVSFQRIWDMARGAAPALSAADHELEAAKIAESRAKRHWYPHVSMTARAFATNDPATSFMSILGQRKITAADFSPSSLNHPGDHVYEQGTLGVDLPLFEGGMKTAMAKASTKTREAKTWEQSATRASHYAALAEHYAALLALRDQKEQLANLSKAVSNILGSYEIRSPSNPVGYSGFLGLKSLKNRIEGLQAENAAKSEAHRSEIQAQAEELPENWTPAAESFRAFLDRSLPLRGRTVKGASQEDAPAAVQAAKSGAEALEKQREIERAKFLPRVGLFAQGDLYGGGRAAGASYASGAYLQWDLFSASNFGSLRQAEQTAAAAHARADELRDRFQAGRATSKSAALALAKNLSLLDESNRLLQEQTAAAQTLYQNGSINALQLVEVLSRRADLIVSRADAELNLSAARDALFVTSGQEVVE